MGATWGLGRLACCIIACRRRHRPEFARASDRACAVSMNLNEAGQQILSSLRAVEAERARRAQSPVMAAAVSAVKRFQHRRFENTYADLLASARYAKAARFFLDELYGPGDFSQRDGEFARVVPALVRLFPAEIVDTVRALAQLHALSECLDSAMGLTLGTPEADAQAYGRAWRKVGDPLGREQQIMLMLSVGEALDRYVRNPLLRHSLRLMRGPARSAGLAALQEFLESGFETFREMRGGSEFLDTVARRERELAARLFAGDGAQ